MANVHGFEFDGPHPVNATFNAVAGVYLIATPSGVIVDVGETENLSERIPNHERRSCWRRNVGTNLWFHREACERERYVIERFIRNKENPACGVF